MVRLHNMQPDKQNPSERCSQYPAKTQSYLNAIPDAFEDQEVQTRWVMEKYKEHQGRLVGLLLAKVRNFTFLPVWITVHGKKCCTKDQCPCCVLYAKGLHLIIIIMYSFMCHFSKVKHIAHYKAKNKTQSKQTSESMQMCTHARTHAWARAHTHTHTESEW